jgi:hypothetical protein
MLKTFRALLITVILCVTAMGILAQDNVTAISPTVLVVTSGANSRECAQTSCAVVMKLKQGTTVTADATAVGQAVNKRNNVWYRVTLEDGRQAFVYSGTVTVSAPPAEVVSGGSTSPAVEQPAAPSAPANTGRPANCTQAREWGLTAEQAAQWSHLDRDHDGVACYGD